MSTTNKPPYVSRSIWTPDRPETLVVCCSDGRWHAPIVDFVDHEVSDRADLFAVPGGPAALDPWNSSFDEARVFDSALRLFEEHHDLRHVWLIQHEGCSYYRVKHPGQSSSAVKERQIADLRRGAEILAARSPKLAVRAIFATLEGANAVFTTIDTSPASGALPHTTSTQLF